MKLLKKNKICGHVFGLMIMSNRTIIYFAISKHKGFRGKESDPNFKIRNTCIKICR